MLPFPSSSRGGGKERQEDGLVVGMIIDWVDTEPRYSRERASENEEV